MGTMGGGSSKEIDCKYSKFGKCAVEMDRISSMRMDPTGYPVDCEGKNQAMLLAIEDLGTFFLDNEWLTEEAIEEIGKEIAEKIDANPDLFDACQVPQTINK